MQIKFLQTVPSETANVPFLAGQTIRVEMPNAYLLSLIDGVRAVAIPSDETERAVAPVDERPEPKRKRGRARAA